MRNAVGFFVAAGQATDSSAVYAGAGRNLGRGSFLDGLLGNERIPPHMDKNQCRSMCTANWMKKSSMASREGGVDEDRESSRHISLCVSSMIKVFMSASTLRCRLPQTMADYASPE